MRNMSLFRAYLALPFLVISAVSGLAQTEKIEALFEAANAGDSTRVRSLLDQGVEINARNRNGETALMRAVALPAREQRNKSANTSVVELLLTRGAEIEATDNRGETALMK